MKKTYWIVAAALVLAGCAAGGSRSMPLAEQLVSEEGGRDLETLERGRALTVTECNMCHRQYWPSEYSPRQWARVAKTMGGKANLGRKDRLAVERGSVGFFARAGDCRASRPQRSAHRAHDQAIARPSLGGLPVALDC